MMLLELFLLGLVVVVSGDCNARVYKICTFMRRCLHSYCWWCWVVLASLVEFERKRNDVRVCSFIGRSFSPGNVLV